MRLGTISWIRLQYENDIQSSINPNCCLFLDCLLEIYFDGDNVLYGSMLCTSDLFVWSAHECHGRAVSTIVHPWTGAAGWKGRRGGTAIKEAHRKKMGLWQIHMHDCPPFLSPIPAPPPIWMTIHGVSWPSGLAYRTQVLVLAAECGFESRPWQLCPWARHLIIIASLHPGVKWVPVRAEFVD